MKINYTSKIPFTSVNKSIKHESIISTENVITKKRQILGKKILVGIQNNPKKVFKGLLWTASLALISTAIISYLESPEWRTPGENNKTKLEYVKKSVKSKVKKIKKKINKQTISKKKLPHVKVHS